MADLFLFLCVLICLTLRHYSTLLSDPESLLSELSGDANSYLRLGIDLGSGTLQESNRWVLNLWTPGIPLVVAGSILAGVPPVMGMAIFSSVLVVFVAKITFRVSLRYEKFFLKYLLFGYLLSIPLLWDTLLGEGLMHSDTIGALLLILFVFYAFQAIFIDESSKYSPYLGGLLMNIMLLFRWSLFPFAVVIVAVACFRLGSVVFQRVVRRQSLSNQKIGVSEYLRGRRADLRRCRKIVTLLLSMCFFAIPYTALSATLIRPPSFAWTTGTDYYAAYAWYTDEDLVSSGAGWLVAGGANWGCRAYPEECQVFNPMALEASFITRDFSTLVSAKRETFLRNPIPALRYKVPIIVENILKGGAPKWGLLSLVMWSHLALYILLKWRAKTPRRLNWNQTGVLLFLLGASVAWLFALTYAHVESRYLLPIFALPLISTFASQKTLQ